MRRSGASHHFAFFNTGFFLGTTVNVKLYERGYIIMSKFLSYLKDENGASAAEYALILAIIGAAIAVAMFFLGGAISNAVDRAGNCITNTSTTAGTC